MEGRIAMMWNVAAGIIIAASLLAMFKFGVKLIGQDEGAAFDKTLGYLMIISSIILMLAVVLSR